MATADVWRVLVTGGYAAAPRRLVGRKRSVLVSVLVDGREVDAFAVSDPYTLRRALRPILDHLPAVDAAVRLQGSVEEWLPFGYGRRRAVVALCDQLAAQRFLAG